MPALDLYAPEKARYSRWIVGASGALLVAYGAFSLFNSLPGSARAPIGGWTPLGQAYPISWALLLGVLVLVAGMVGMWWAINYAKLVNFLQDCEVEMGKVSWASRSEVISSSIVVCVGTAMLAGWVYFADLVLVGVRHLLGG